LSSISNPGGLPNHESSPPLRGKKIGSRGKWARPQHGRPPIAAPVPARKTGTNRQYRDSRLCESIGLQFWRTDGQNNVYRADKHKKQQLFTHGNQEIFQRGRRTEKIGRGEGNGTRGETFPENSGPKIAVGRFFVPDYASGKINIIPGILGRTGHIFARICASAARGRSRWKVGRTTVFQRPAM